MLLEKSREITPERMKRQSQSENNTRLWMWLVMELKSGAVKSSISSHRKTLNNKFKTPWQLTEKLQKKEMLYFFSILMMHSPALVTSDPIFSFCCGLQKLCAQSLHTVILRKAIYLILETCYYFPVLGLLTFWISIDYAFSTDRGGKYFLIFYINNT